MKYLNLELSKSLQESAELAGVGLPDSGLVFKEATCNCHPYFLEKTDELWKGDVVLSRVFGMYDLLDFGYSIVSYGDSCLKSSYERTRKESRLLTIMRQIYKPMNKERLPRLAEAIIAVLKERAK